MSISINYPTDQYKNHINLIKLLIRYFLNIERNKQILSLLLKIMFCDCTFCGITEIPRFIFLHFSIAPELK